jgi:hypothetical protein
MPSMSPSIRLGLLVGDLMLFGRLRRESVMIRPGHHEFRDGL